MGRYENYGQGSVLIVVSTHEIDESTAAYSISICAIGTIGSCTVSPWIPNQVVVLEVSWVSLFE